MGIDFFGENKKKKNNESSKPFDSFFNASGTPPADADLPQNLEDEKRNLKDDKHVSFRPEANRAYHKLVKLFKDSKVQFNSSNAPPLMPLSPDIIKFLIGNNVFEKFCFDLGNNDYNIDHKDLTAESFMKMSTDERNAAFAATMLRTLAHVMNAMYEVFEPDTDLEMQLLSIVSTYENILYNTRTTLSMQANFLADPSCELSMETLANLSSALESNIKEDGTVTLDSDSVAVLKSVFARFVDISAINQTAAETIGHQLTEQYKVHKDVLKALKIKRGKNKDV